MGKNSQGLEAKMEKKSQRWEDRLFRNNEEGGESARGPKRQRDKSKKQVKIERGGVNQRRKGPHGVASPGESGKKGESVPKQWVG